MARTGDDRVAPSILRKARDYIVSWLGCGPILGAVAAPDSEHFGSKELRHDWPECRGAQHQHKNGVQDTVINEAMPGWIECFEAHEGCSQRGRHLRRRQRPHAL